MVLVFGQITDFKFRPYKCLYSQQGFRSVGISIIGSFSNDDGDGGDDTG